METNDKKLANRLAQQRFREKVRKNMGEEAYKKAENLARRNRRSKSPTVLKGKKERMEGLLKGKVESITQLEKEARGIQGNINLIKKDIAKYGERGFIERLRKEQARLDEKMRDIELGREHRQGMETQIADLEAKLTQPEPEPSGSNVTMSLTQTEEALQALGEDVLDMEDSDIFEFLDSFERESDKQLAEALKTGLRDEPRKAPEDLFTTMDRMLETADKRLVQAVGEELIVPKADERLVKALGEDPFLAMEMALAEDQLKSLEKKSTLDTSEELIVPKADERLVKAWGEDPFLAMEIALAEDQRKSMERKRRELETVVEELGIEESKAELVEEEVREPKRENTESTLKQRQLIINRIAKAVGADTSDISWLYGDKVMNYLEGKYKNANTKRTYYSQIVRYLEENDGDKAEIEKYYKLMYGYIDEVKHTRMENVKSEADEATMFDWNDLKLAKKDRPLNHLDNVVYQLYTSIPPRRNEFATLRLVKYKSPKQLSGLTKGNWLVTTGSGMNIKSIILNDYKTAKTYGQYKITPPLPIKEAFKTYLGSHDIKEGELVFPEYATSPKWTGLVKSVFGSATGKEAGVNSIRKSFVNWKEKGGRLSQAKRQEFATAMGTSLAEWHTDYVKL